MNGFLLQADTVSWLVSCSSDNEVLDYVLKPFEILLFTKHRKVKEERT